MDPGRDRGGIPVGIRDPTLSIVIPVYNEGDNIAPTLQGLHEHVHVAPLEILIVYDFEEDTTLPVVRRLQRDMPQVRLHKNDEGRGALNALKAGFRGARAPHVLVMMADCADDPRDIDRMHELATGGADVVAGSRYMPRGGQHGGPLVKRTLSRAAGLSLHHVAGVGTHDPTNNFKVYSRRLLDAVRIESDAGFELALELTVKAHLAGMRIAEVPTVWRDRSAGESRFRTWQWMPHYLRWYLMAMRHRFRVAGR